MELPKMSAFCFSIFTGMSVLCIAFLWSNLFISFRTSPTLTLEKLKLWGLNAFLIADTLGWFRNFITAFKAGWEMHSAEKSISLNSGIFKSFSKLEKNYFSVLASSSLLVIILSSCNIVIFPEDFALSDKIGFLVFQSLILSLTYFSFKLP